MVRSKGFEPLTFWFVAKHSIQLSYERMPRKFYKWWLQRELNQRHKDFQSSALPTELWSQKNGGPYGIRTRDLLRDRQTS